MTKQTDNRYFFDESKAATHLTPNGREIPDPTPMEPPLGYKRSPSLAEQIRTMVRSEQLALAAEAAGAETFEEADDFNIGDDYDPQSPYENEFDPPISEVLAAGHRALAEKAKLATPPPSKPGGETTTSEASHVSDGEPPKTQN